MIQVHMDQFKGINFSWSRVSFGWTQVVKIGVSWSTAVQKSSSGSNLVKTSPNGSKMFHCGPSRLRWVYEGK